MRILIIEDEPGVVRMLERGLEAHGYQCVSAEDGEEGVRLATDETADEAVDLALLDIMLPGLDGHEALSRIRSVRPELPVLMLTARDELQHKVGAFEGGADDYLTKPFAFEELLARVRALSRRADQNRASRLEAGDLTMDLLSRHVERSGKRVDLSSREFALLEYLVRHSGQDLSRQRILSEIWDYSFDPGSNTVDVYVRYLRKKLDRSGEASLIVTVRGVGYRFEPPRETQEIQEIQSSSPS